MPPEAKASIGKFVAKMPQLIATRHTVDAGRMSRLDVYRAYNDVADAMIVAADAIGKDSTDKEVALDRAMASDLMRASDWLDRANALAAAALAGDGLPVEELNEYNRLTQGYRAELDALAPPFGTAAGPAIGRGECCCRAGVLRTRAEFAEHQNVKG
jgi:hypothetical protein